LQDGFKKAAENLQDTVISNTLKIDVISDQFEVDIPATQSIPDWLTSALSVCDRIPRSLQQVLTV